jgi:hypothetical protein
MNLYQLTASRRINRRRAILGTAGLLAGTALTGSLARPAKGEAASPLLAPLPFSGSVQRAGFPARHHHLLATGPGSSRATSQLSAGSKRSPAPVPIPGGDVLGPPDFPPFQIHQFAPGPAVGFDGVDAEPNGITNFRGLVALAYTSGTATDNSGVVYPATTDIRAYQGEYVGATGTHARGTFVEI